MSEALKPLHRLEKIARGAHAARQLVHARDVELSIGLKKRSSSATLGAAEPSRKGVPASLPDLIEPEAPTARRYVVNDTSYEALGEILADNPNGVLAFRDELSPSSRGSTARNRQRRAGFSSRLGTERKLHFRPHSPGKTHIEAACLSLLGSTQPGRLAEYVDARFRAARATMALFSDSDSWFGRIKTATGKRGPMAEYRGAGNRLDGRSTGSKADIGRDRGGARSIRSVAVPSP